MTKINRFIAFSMISIFLCLTGYIIIYYYPFVFSKTIHGEIYNVDRIMQSTVITSAQVDPQIYSFAVAIKTPNGEIFTATSEDRQWAVVRRGQCAETRLFPYPPWQLDKAGTYFNARLLKLSDCPGAAPATTPAPALPTPQPSGVIEINAIPTASASEVFSIVLTDGKKTLPLTIEDAVTETERRKGLMFREKLDPKTGMLFVFKPAQRITLWMKNVNFNLEAGCFDQSGKLLETFHMVPCKSDPCQIYPSESDAVSYLIEWTPELLKTHGLNPATTRIQDFKKIKSRWAKVSGTR